VSGRKRKRPLQLIAPSTTRTYQSYTYAGFPTPKLLLKELLSGNIRDRTLTLTFKPRRGTLFLGKGFGHITKQANRTELGDKLRKVASDHGANVIAYEISGTEFRVLFVREPDDIFNATSRAR
jgi:hypothetical protein